MSSLCSLCETAHASVHCVQCATELCLECSTQLHASKKMASHQCTPLVVAATPSSELCAICEAATAVVHCQQCQLKLCLDNDCDQQQHRPKNKSGHIRTPLVTTASPNDATKKPSHPIATSQASHSTLAASTAPNASSSAATNVLSSTEPSTAIPVASHADAALMPLPKSTTPSLCTVCETESIAVICATCSSEYCADCDAQFHAPVKMRSHQRSPISSLQLLAPTQPIQAAPAFVAPIAVAAETKNEPLNARASLSSVISAPTLTSLPLPSPSEIFESTRDSSNNAAPVVAASSSIAPNSPRGSMRINSSSSLLASLNPVVATVNPRRTTAPLKFAAPLLNTVSGSNAHTRLSSVPLSSLKSQTLASSNAFASMPSVAVECDVCEIKEASLRCDECNLTICADADGGCDAEIHASKKMQSHTRRPIKAVSATTKGATSDFSSCSICEENEAMFDCKECSATYCQSCNTDFHIPPRMRNHVRTQRSRPVVESTEDQAAATRYSPKFSSTMPLTTSTVAVAESIPNGDSFSSYASIISRLTALESTLKTADRERTEAERASLKSNNEIQQRLSGIQQSLEALAIRRQSLDQSKSGSNAVVTPASPVAGNQEMALAHSMLREIMEHLSKIEHHSSSLVTPNDSIASPNDSIASVAACITESAPVSQPTVIENAAPPSTLTQLTTASPLSITTQTSAKSVWSPTVPTTQMTNAEAPSLLTPIFNIVISKCNTLASLQANFDLLSTFSLSASTCSSAALAIIQRCEAASVAAASLRAERRGVVNGTMPKTSNLKHSNDVWSEESKNSNEEEPAAYAETEGLVVATVHKNKSWRYEIDDYAVFTPNLMRS